jgi:hypothetical protein
VMRIRSTLVEEVAPVANLTSGGVALKRCCYADCRGQEGTLAPMSAFVGSGHAIWTARERFTFHERQIVHP